MKKTRTTQTERAITLRLRAETVRALQDKTLSQVAGGQLTDPPSCTGYCTTNDEHGDKMM